MVQALINVSKHTNRVLNIVKAKHGLKDTSEAINLVAEQHEEFILEPELRPNTLQKQLKFKKKHPSKLAV